MSNDRDKMFWAGIGGAVVFGLCLILGILDHFKYLDPVLDFLHIP